jgi:multiple sugar transport system substrate-binding protein
MVSEVASIPHSAALTGADRVARNDYRLGRPAVLPRKDTAMVASRRAFLARGAVFGAAAAAAAACSPGIGQSLPKALPPASLWGMTRGNLDLDSQFAQQFAAATPGMQVKIEPMGEGGNQDNQIAKAKTLAAAGDAPDVFVHLDNSQVAQIVSTGGVLEPLDSYLSRDATANIKEIEPEVQAQYHVARKTYGLARGIALGAMFYNQDLFAAAGIPVPSAEWGHSSWQIDAVLNLARRLTKRDSDGSLRVAGLALRTNITLGDIAGAWIASNGGAFVDDLEAPKQCLLDRPEALAVLQLIVDLGPKIGVAPTAADLNGQDQMQWFIDGKVAMYLGGAFQIAALRKGAQFVWDAAPHPWFKRPAVVLGGSGNSLSAGSKVKDAAWALTKYLASADYQRAQIRIGSDAPTRSSVLNGPEYVNDTPPPKSRRVMAESVKYGRALNVRTKDAAEFVAAWRSGAGALFNGQVTPIAYAQDVSRKVAPYLEK